ncbi:LARP4 [Candida theae]|uniref:LARP4 n=1 Tax=Candida theae TaxID=1198502 RepID=A0AAD5BL44_9ASCO|nr:LARP4 [Candida theae]KAI5968889.1 LARP4 [Candida theae]
MSNIRRLTPAPPPTTNAWDFNTLVLSKPQDNIVAATTTDAPICKQNTEPAGPSNLHLESPSVIQTSARVAPLSDASSVVELSQPKMAARITNKPTKLVNVGNRVKVKKPTLPRSWDIKGGTNLLKYKVTDRHTKQPISMSQPDLRSTEPGAEEAATTTTITTTTTTTSTAALSTTTLPTTFYPLKPDMAFFSHCAEDHPYMSTDPASIPSPILIPSPNSSLFPQSPGMFPPQQPMVVFGMPVYSHLPLQHSSPQLPIPIPTPYTPCTPMVPLESKRDTLKKNIKKQLQYYFSTENLCKDTYLRSLFDKTDGKLKVKKLLEFNKIKVLTHNGKYAEMVTGAAKELPLLEVLEGNEYIRLKTWEKWVMP